MCQVWRGELGQEGRQVQLGTRDPRGSLASQEPLESLASSDLQASKERGVAGVSKVTVAKWVGQGLRETWEKRVSQVPRAPLVHRESKVTLASTDLLGSRVQRGLQVYPAWRVLQAPKELLGQRDPKERQDQSAFQAPLVHQAIYLCFRQIFSSKKINQLRNHQDLPDTKEMPRYGVTWEIGSSVKRRSLMTSTW